MGVRPQSLLTSKGTKLHAPANLSPWKHPPSSIEQQGGWGPALVRMLCQKMKNLLHLPGIEPRFLGCRTRSLVNIPITLSRVTDYYIYVSHLSLGFCDLCPNFNCRGIAATYVTLKLFPSFGVHCSSHLQGKWNGRKQ
jgi:hypothetical protein